MTRSVISLISIGLLMFFGLLGLIYSIRGV